MSTNSLESQRIMLSTRSEMQSFLRPYHVFSYENQWYVFNQEFFAFERVPLSFVDLLRALEKEPGTPVSEEERKCLSGLNLIQSNPEHSPGFQKDKDSDPPISTAIVFVTQHCNHRCIYCYGGGGVYGHCGNMEEKTGLHILDWLWRQRGQEETIGVSFFGGEPLLNFSLIRKMVAHARQLESGSAAGFHFSLATNAALLDNHVLEFIEKHNIYALIGFDGPLEIHDRNRPMRNGSSSYETVVPRIKKLLEQRPDQVTLRATIWEKGDLPEVVRELASLNPSIYQTVLASPGGHMQEGGPEPSAECSELVEAVRETVPVFLKALREKDIQTLKLILKWTGFNHILNVISRRYKRTGTCGVGRNTIAVSCRGTFYPCHRFVGHKDYALGNVFTGQLNRGVYLEPPLLTSQQCLNCWARHFCNGGCIGDHLVKTGHRFQPSQDFCQMTKSLLETGIHLASQLSQEEKEFLYDKGLIQRPFCPLDL